jgi:hypothetical protein
MNAIYFNRRVAGTMVKSLVGEDKYRTRYTDDPRLCTPDDAQIDIAKYVEYFKNYFNL